MAKIYHKNFYTVTIIQETCINNKQDNEILIFVHLNVRHPGPFETRLKTFNVDDMEIK